MHNPLINDMLLILFASTSATCERSDTDKALKKQYILSLIALDQQSIVF